MRKTRIKSLLLFNVTLILIGVFETPIAASEITSIAAFDNLSDASYGNSGYWTGYDQNIDASVMIGRRFTTPSAGFISSIALSAFGNESTSVQIYSDNNGKIGTQIDSLQLTGGKGYGTYALGEFKTGTQLNANTTYWVTVSDPGENWYSMDGIEPEEIFISQNQGKTIKLDLSVPQNYSHHSALGLKVCITASMEPGGMECSGNQKLKAINESIDSALPPKSSSFLRDSKARKHPSTPLINSAKMPKPHVDPE